MDKSKVIIVVGNVGIGKSTFGKMLAKHLGVKSMDTSDILCDLLARKLQIDPRKFEDRNFKNKHRQDLVNLGNALCDKRQDFLVAKAVEYGCCVVIGVRRLSEALQAKENWDTSVILLERTADENGIPPPTPFSKAESNEFKVSSDVVDFTCRIPWSENILDMDYSARLMSLVLDPKSNRPKKGSSTLIQTSFL